MAANGPRRRRVPPLSRGRMLIAAQMDQRMILIGEVKHESAQGVN
jgi:hypothetical protein